MIGPPIYDCTTYRVVPLHVEFVDAPDAEVAAVDLEPDGVLALALLLPLHQRDDHRAARLVVVRIGIFGDEQIFFFFVFSTPGITDCLFTGIR